MKKQLLFLFVFLCSHSTSMAQQKPQYSQYILNNYIINPALSGIEDYIDVKVASHQQWSGLKDAPKTNYLTIQFPIGKSDERSDPGALDLIGEGIHVYDYRNDYAVSAPHHGVGLAVVNDRTGPIKQTTVDFSYAYHLGISAKLNIALGISAGINKTNIDFSDLNAEEESDIALSSAPIQTIKPDINAGIWIYAPNYFVGASIQQLLPHNKTIANSNGYSINTTVPHYFITAGYKVWIDDNFTIIPSAMLKIVNPAPLAVDYNLKIAFKDKLWLGGSYQAQNSSAAFLGVNISSLVHISYAYDFTTSELSAVAGASQEILIGLTLNNKRKILQPLRFW